MKDTVVTMSKMENWTNGMMSTKDGLRSSPLIGRNH
eukprot:CAMPEP_0194782806 /NCGR_PEP_ID=MMETSP0323_2-20130528/78886_1 /TAXON_ID=2866 ORGANISM="Crypthecodinium cohnii, Strain Seligo" /NCGR_SAMPLE_ID=MMETSP0323_2 /ASSEMBLY_ACC=CAM_ASM_000346 /LENGTH=35 /DNA_ID= /DNA_START= /DNA_END= /DNA_ORIENTATION=